MADVTRHPRGRARRLFIGALGGAAIVLLGIAPGARAATVSHFLINDVSVTEGSAGTANLTFTIRYTGTKNDISVDWATANGTATAGADYVAASGTATFTTTGPMSKQITVVVNGDVLDETNETVLVNLTNAQPPAIADITDTQGVGTITDDDPPPTLSIDDVSVVEGDAGTTTLGYTVSLSVPSGRAVNVTATTANGTATQPADYVSRTQNVAFAPGTTTQAFAVTVNGDLLDENDETVLVNLTSPGNATIADAQSVGTITDDDPLPAITVNDVSFSEGNANTSNVTLTLTLTPASGRTVTVDYATADGTAAAPADYQTRTGTVTFNAGQLTRTFTVPVVGDVLDEFDEIFVVDLSNPTNAVIADAQGIVTIVDNDPLPSLSTANVTVTEGDAGTTTATFTVTLSAASAKPVSVDFATADGTATAGADYSATSGTLSYPPGTTTRTVDVTIFGDLLNEANETFTLDLSNATNATIATPSRTGTITNDDPLPSVVIDDVSVPEGDSGTTNAVFTLTLSSPSGRAITVRDATANGTATQPADYTSTTVTVSFPAGSSTQTMSVPVVGDLLNEANDTFFVNLTLPTNVTIADNQGIGTIIDDDPLPSISIADASRNEGNSGTANLTFTLTLSPVSGRSVTVNWATADGTATAPADYTASSGTVTFAAGQTSRTFTVPVVGDLLDEYNETLLVNLSTPTDATIADGQAVGTIVDNDPPPSFGVNDVTVSEGDTGTGTATFVVSLSATSAKPISVDYATTDGTATRPDDYQSASGTLSFAPGDVSAVVDVTIESDLLNEFDETFTLDLSNAVNSTIADGQGIGTITDDDPAPVVSIADLTTPEGDAGITTASLLVTLSAPSGKPVTVDVATADVTAVDGSDYAGLSTTVSFAQGETTKTVDVAVSGDVAYENDETFGVTLSNPVNVLMSSGAATVTIVNDDPVPAVSVDDVAVDEGDASDSTMTFTVTLTNPSAFPISVDVATADGTAGSPGDYDAGSASLPFAPGETTHTFDVMVHGDATYEGDETFDVLLSNVIGAAVSVDTGRGTIRNDDVAPVIDVGDVTVTEGDAGDTIASFVVTLTGATDVPARVDASTIDGTAGSPLDFDALAATVTILPGATSATIDVVGHGDTMLEPDEAFGLDLTNPVDGTIGDGSGSGTILNDDPVPAIAVDDVAMPEGDAGTSPLTFTISVGNPSSVPVTVDVATEDQSAVAPDDYQATAATLTIAPGLTSTTIDVPVVGDDVPERDETFGLRLSNPSESTITDDLGLGTIADDDRDADGPGTGNGVSVGDVSVVERAAGSLTSADFAVRLSRPAEGWVRVDYRTLEGSAADGRDFDGVAGTLSIPPGGIVSTIRVPVFGDDGAEQDETFELELSNAHGATIQHGTATGTIVNDDLVHPRLSGHPRGRGERIVVRGRLVRGAEGATVRVVLLRRTARGWTRVATALVGAEESGRSTHAGAPVEVFRVRFRHQAPGLYLVRAIYRGDDAHLPCRARDRVRL